MGLIDHHQALPPVVAAVIGQLLQQLRGQRDRSRRPAAGSADSSPSRVAATSRIVGRDGNDTQHALTWLVRRARAASTAKVLPSPACPCTAPIARVATRSATA